MTDCHLCGKNIDPDSMDTVRINPEPTLYRHSKCDLELETRYNSNLCPTCGETPNGLDRESCVKCGTQYCDPDRKYINF